MRQRTPAAGQAGFSLAELMVAMAVTLILMSVASTLLSEAFKTRTRENQRTEALADAQRAINIMAREIANAGFNLSTNGIVPGDSGPDAAGRGTIRVRANLNKYDTSASAAASAGIGTPGVDVGEDIKFFLQDAANTTLLVRHDAYAANPSTVLANRLDALQFYFYADRVTYTTGDCNNAAVAAPDLISNALTPAGAAAAQVAPNLAKYVVIAACARLDAVGAPDSPGYQPASSVLLVSDVALRKAFVSKY